MIFSLLIYNYYSASVVSARLNEPIVKLNDSLDSLATTDLKVASEPMLYFDFFMKVSIHKIYYIKVVLWLKSTIIYSTRVVHISKYELDMDSMIPLLMLYLVHS